jgi:ubiquinone/menaquinone biosynthesis C-methylase UbiE
LSEARGLDALFSDFYLRAYAADQASDEARDQALGALTLAGAAPGATVLDVPCGFGRHAIPLAEAGYAVTGVDRSPVLLAEARRRAPELTFVEADYRRLPLPDDGFDVAVNLYTSIGYLSEEEDIDVLAEIRRVLRPGGVLVLEAMHRDGLVVGFSEHDWRAAGAGRLLLEQRTYDLVTGVAQVTQTLIDGDGTRDSRAWSVRVYSATELIAMLFAAGFEEARCYGDFDGGRLTTESRLVIVSRA